MIVDRYLTREVAWTFLAVCSVLVVVFLTYSLARFLTDAASGLLTPDEVIKLTALKVLIALEVLLPIGLYFGLIIGMGNLHSHSEIIAFQSCGVGDERLRRPVIRFTVLLILLVASISLLVRPWAYDRIFTLEATAEASSDLARIKPGEFYINEDDNRVVFVDSVSADGSQLNGVFIRTRGEDFIQVIASAKGSMESFVTPAEHRIRLDRVHMFRQADDVPNVSFKARSAGTFEIQAATPEDTSYRSKSKSSLTLFRSSASVDRAELQWRLSTPLSTLLLSLLALRLSHSRPREGKLTRLPIALAIYAVYFNLLGISRNWVEQETFPYIWWVPGLLIVLLLFWVIPWNRMRQQWD